MVEDSFIGVIVGGALVIFGNYVILRINQNNTKKNLKNAIIADVMSRKDMIISFCKMHPDPENITNSLLIPQSFYSDNGIYYKIQGDILNLNDEESKIAYTFYIHLLIAEEERKLILESDPQLGNTLVYTKRMIASLHVSSNLIQDIMDFDKHFWQKSKK